jgi:hypothetical protein
VYANQTGEAAALEMLEGRHPLALAHFANHPPAGAAPNAVIASFTFAPIGCQQPEQQQGAAAAEAAGGSAGRGAGGDASSGSSSGGSSSRALTLPPAAERAYVPNIDYAFACDAQHLLSHEVSCVGLVAVQPLPAGSEVLFNYRLSPSLLGRPAWYVPVDDKEENMRWA